LLTSRIGASFMSLIVLESGFIERLLL